MNTKNCRVIPFSGKSLHGPSATGRGAVKKWRIRTLMENQRGQIT